MCFQTSVTEQVVDSKVFNSHQLLPNIQSYLTMVMHCQTAVNEESEKVEKLLHEVADLKV